MNIRGARGIFGDERANSGQTPNCASKLQLDSASQLLPRKLSDCRWTAPQSIRVESAITADEQCGRGSHSAPVRAKVDNVREQHEKNDRTEHLVGVVAPEIHGDSGSGDAPQSAPMGLLIANIAWWSESRDRDARRTVSLLRCRNPRDSRLAVAGMKAVMVPRRLRHRAVGLESRALISAFHSNLPQTGTGPLRTLDTWRGRPRGGHVYLQLCRFSVERFRNLQKLCPGLHVVEFPRKTPSLLSAHANLGGSLVRHAISLRTTNFR